MRVTVRLLGLDLLEVDITTSDQCPQRDSDVGIAAVVDTSPERVGFEDRSARLSR